MFRQGIEPAPVGGGLAPLQHVLKEGVPPADVVEHAVDQHPQAQPVGLLHQRPEVVLRATGGVDAEVIQRVVLVIGRGGEDGVQIQAVEAHVLQVIQIFPNSVQRAAKPGKAAFALKVRLTRPA